MKLFLSLRLFVCFVSPFVSSQSYIDYKTISDVSNEMLVVALGDIKSRISSYLSSSTAIIPAAKYVLVMLTGSMLLKDVSVMRDLMYGFQSLLGGKTN